MNIVVSIWLVLVLTWTTLVPGEQTTSGNLSESFRTKRQLNTLPLVYPYGSTYRFILGIGSPVKVEEGISLIFGVAFLYQYVQFDNITRLSQFYPIKTISRESRSSFEDDRNTFQNQKTQLNKAELDQGIEITQKNKAEVDQGIENTQENKAELGQEIVPPDVNPKEENALQEVRLEIEVDQTEDESILTQERNKEKQRGPPIEDIPPWEGRRDERLAFYKAVEEMLIVKGLNGRDCLLRAICEAAQHPVAEEGLFGELLHILLTPTYGKDLHSADSTWRQQLADYVDAQEAGDQMFSCRYIYPGCPDEDNLLDLISALRDE